MNDKGFYLFFPQVPKSGYINAMDFKSPKELAQYMLYLDGNKTAYNSYFKWKKHVTFKDNFEDVFCSMCVHLNMQSHFGVRKNVLHDLGNYWSQKDCKYPVFDKNFEISYATYSNEPLFPKQNIILIVVFVCVLVLFIYRRFLKRFFNKFHK